MFYMSITDWLGCLKVQCHASNVAYLITFRNMHKIINTVHVWLCCNTESFSLCQCWGRSVPLNLFHKPLWSNLAQSTAAKFHELYWQALNPFLCSWSSTVIQADAIKKCLFMRPLTSKTFRQTNCASVTRLLPFFPCCCDLFLSEPFLQ